MDIYEATQALLESVVTTGTNVSSFVLTYDEDKDEFVLPQFPAVTYNYSGIWPVVSQAGESNLYRVNLDVEVWGDLADIDTNARAVTSAVNAQRVQVGNVEFTLVCNQAQDVAELGLSFKRRQLGFIGLAAIGEEPHTSC